MIININLKGKNIFNRLFKILALSFNWDKLQPRDFEVAAELFYQNYLLMKDGVTKEDNRMQILFNKKNKNKLAEKINISYNGLANSISKLRKAYLGDTSIITENRLNPILQKINPDEKDLSLIVMFNPSGLKYNLIEKDGK